MRDKTNKPILGFKPSTFEMIDLSVFNWLQNLQIKADYPDGWRMIPIIWSTQERSYQIKHNPEIRDNNGKIIFPIISIQKESINKDLGKKGAFFGNIFPVDDTKGGSINIVRRIQQNKTQNFANTVSKDKTGQINFRLEPKNEQIVYETISVPMPIHYEIIYKIQINTNYESEMNKILQTILQWSGNINHFTLKHEGHLYDAFLDGDIDQSDNKGNLEDNLRDFTSILSLRVLGYTQGSGDNDKQPYFVVRENAVKVKFPTERKIYNNSTSRKILYNVRSGSSN